jgi:hypothetical protein
MQNNKLEPNCVNEAVAELFHLHLKPTEIGRFVEKGQQVHEFFLQFEGYICIDILFLSDIKVMVLIRWNSFKLFDMHLPIILNACPIKDWLKDAEHIAQQPTILKTFSKEINN